MPEPSGRGADAGRWLIVFDPDDEWTPERLLQRIAGEVPDPVDDRLRELVATIEGRWSPNRKISNPWTQPPALSGHAADLFLRRGPTGDVSPTVRRTAVDLGLAVMDADDLAVFAPKKAQERFEQPPWGLQGKLPSVPWLRVGVPVRHKVFGRGRVLDVGDYKGVTVVIVDFRRGPKMLGADVIESVLKPRRGRGR